MMRHLIYFFMLIIPSAALYAQGGMNDQAREKIESVRIGLITERLNLTPAQAEKFWPLYNEYSEKRKAIFEERDAVRRSVNNSSTEKDKQQAIQKELEYKQTEVALEEEYTKKLLDVLTVQQVLELRKAEEDFRRLLLERLERQRRERRQQMERIEQRRRNIDRNFDDEQGQPEARQHRQRNRSHTRNIQNNNFCAMQ